MADNKICILLPPELRAHLIQIAEAHGIELSECVRACLYGAVNGLGALGGVDAGFIEGRRMMRRILHNLLQEAQANLPATFEEAQLRYGSEQP